MVAIGQCFPLAYTFAEPSLFLGLGFIQGSLYVHKNDLRNIRTPLLASVLDDISDFLVKKSGTQGSILVRDFFLLKMRLHICCENNV